MTEVTKAGSALKKAIRAQFLSLGSEVSLPAIVSRPWASVTFRGERHRLTCLLCGSGARAVAEAFCDGLPDRDIPLAGHILADIEVADTSVNEEGATLTLEALTVEDR